MSAPRTSRLLGTRPGLRHGFLPAGEVPPAGFLRVRQVHGDKVVFVDGQLPEAVATIEADALVGSSASAVAVQTADCLPVLMAVESGARFAAAHAGWRGLEAGVLLRTVEALALNGGVGAVHVAIGPAVGPCCYEVSSEVIEAFEERWGHLWRGERPPYSEVQPEPRMRDRAPAVARAQGVWLDLGRIARLQLESAGVSAALIEDLAACTYCGPPAFSSFRRSTHDQTARRHQWSWIGRGPA